MIAKLLIRILLLTLPLTAFCQMELSDSIGFGSTVSDSLQVKPAIENDRAFNEYNRYSPINHHIIDMLPYRKLHPLELNVPDLSFIPGQSSLFQWNTGKIIAAGGSVAYPGLMRVDNGSTGIYQTFGNLHFYAGATVNKYGWFRGLQTQYGLNGSLSYRFSPKLSLTLYGTYYFGQPPRMANGMPMPPSMLGYYGYSKFGGYVDYTANDSFGVQVGAQAVKRTGNNRYEPEPIVTPYIKAGRKKKIGIGLPVGQILYHMLRK